MKNIIVIFALLFASSVIAQTPSGYSTWDLGGNEHIQKFGVGPYNYYNEDSSSWVPIETAWEEWSRGWKSIKSKRRLYVDTLNDLVGFVIDDHEGNRHKLGTKIGPLFFYHRTSHDTVRIASPNLSNYSMSGDTVTITNVYPNVNCLLISTCGGMKHNFVFGRAADSAIDFRWDSAGANQNVYVVNTFRLFLDSIKVSLYDDGGGVDTSTAQDITGDLNFKAIGKRLFGIMNSRVWQGNSNWAKLFKRIHKFGSQVWFFEGYRVADVYDWPAGGYQHNDQKDFSGTTLIEDGFMYSSIATTNYGGDSYLRYSSTRKSILQLMPAYVDSLGANKVISNVIFSVYAYSVGESGEVGSWMVWKNETNEDFMTWNRWGENLEWGTAGAQSTNDAGSYNTTDGGGDDRTATASDAVTMNGVGWWSWSLDSAACNIAYTNGYAITAILGRTGAVGAAYFYSTETAESQKPNISVIYSEAGEAAQTYRRRRILIEQ